MDKINNKLWETNKGIVAEFKNYNLIQLAEAIILVKYRDFFKQQNVIDLGCGGGRFTPFFIPFANKYVGIDYSISLIDFCKKKFGHKSFIHGCMDNLGMFENEYFGFALAAFNSIDYISHETRLKALMEINRVLKKGAIFVFSSHNRDCTTLFKYPKFYLTFNLFTQFKNIISFMNSMYNFLKNKPKEISTPEFKIINDPAFGFAQLVYYIDLKSQINQLSRFGFEVLEMYSVDGKLLTLDITDSFSPWVYYVVKKT